MPSKSPAQAAMDENIRVNDILDSVQTQNEMGMGRGMTPRHDLRHPTTGRFVAASKPKRGMETGFGIKGARPTQ